MGVVEKSSGGSIPRQLWKLLHLLKLEQAQNLGQSFQTCSTNRPYPWHPGNLRPLVGSRVPGSTITQSPVAFPVSNTEFLYQ